MPFKLAALVLAAFVTHSIAIAGPPDDEKVGGTAADRAAVQRATLDYAEAYYERKREYFERSVHDDLFKVGLVRGDGEAYEQRPMTKAELIAMVDRLIERDWTPPPGPKDVKLLQVGKNIALVKLTGAWGVDYMQLTKEDARWQIRHVVWQSHPEDRKPSAGDRTAVEAALDAYVDAFYKNEHEAIEPVISPRLSKIGFMASEDGTLRRIPMSIDQLRSLAQRIDIPDDAPRSVKIIDMMDQTACARIEAVWGVDVVHLAKIDGTWQILQIVWEG